MKINRNMKDRLFRLVFTDKRAIIQLYNAVNSDNTPISLDEEVEITTLDDAIYMKMKNDLSFIVSGNMCLFEHQSTYNPNMPLRGLLYFSELYSKLTEGTRKLYSSQLLQVPCPQYVVFYIGSMLRPEREIMKLSDAFNSNGIKSCLELEVLVLNVNLGKNKQLMDDCPRLKEYAIFIGKVREYAYEGDILNAVNQAIDECVKDHILTDILSAKKQEVIDTVLAEYDEEKHVADEKEISFQKGKLEGKQEMIKNLLDGGMSFEVIAKYASLTVEEVKKLLNL